MLAIHPLPAGDRTGLDVALFVLAAVILPVSSWLRGRRIGRNPAASLVSRYAWMIVRGAALTLLVLADWRLHDRSMAALGLDLPVGTAGRIGLAAVTLLAAAAAIYIVRGPRLASPERIRQLRDDIGKMKILPRSNAETVWFLVVAVMAGFWEELLFRGFAIWFLLPFAGVAGAILVSTLAFASGHLYQGWRGSLRSGGVGLAFAICYVATGSLWWLIGLHALIDLTGGLLAWRLRPQASAVAATGG